MEFGQLPKWATNGFPFVFSDIPEQGDQAIVVRPAGPSREVILLQLQIEYDRHRVHTLRTLLQLRKDSSDALISTWQLPYLLRVGPHLDDDTVKRERGLLSSSFIPISQLPSKMNVVRNQESPFLSKSATLHVAVGLHHALHLQPSHQYAGSQEYVAVSNAMDQYVNKIVELVLLDEDYGRAQYTGRWLVCRLPPCTMDQEAQFSPKICAGLEQAFIQQHNLPLDKKTMNSVRLLLGDSGLVSTTVYGLVFDGVNDDLLNVFRPAPSILSPMALEADIRCSTTRSSNVQRSPSAVTSPSPAIPLFWPLSSSPIRPSDVCYSRGQPEAEEKTTEATKRLEATSTLHRLLSPTRAYEVLPSPLPLQYPVLPMTTFNEDVDQSVRLSGRICCEEWSEPKWPLAADTGLQALSSTVARNRRRRSDTIVSAAAMGHTPTTCDKAVKKKKKESRSRDRRHKKTELVQGDERSC